MSKLLTDILGLVDASCIYPYSLEPWSSGQGPDDYIPGGRAWNWDITRDPNTGHPVVAFQVQFGANVDNNATFRTTRIFYYYASWDGTQWNRKFIAQGGRPIYDTQKDYGGGMAIDPDNPNIIYISTNAQNPFDLSDTSNSVPLSQDEKYRIYKGETRDGGKTFEWTALTPNSTVDNLRPIVPENHGFNEHVVWFAGRYTTYLNFDAEVKMIAR